MPYYGGKGRKAINEWIASLLPAGKVQLYVEPCAGMLSILLNRQPASNELACDSNHHLMEWWRAVRDIPDELAAKVYQTPRHRDIHQEAYQMLFGDGADPDALPLVDRAWAVTIVVTDGIQHCCSQEKSNTWAPKYGSGKIFTRRGLTDRISALSDRVREVQFETRPAPYTLERVASIPGALLYLDPPYWSSDTCPYGQLDLDVDEWLTLLRAQKGRVAISGFGDEWDALDWRRHERRSTCFTTNGLHQPRTEVLWTNYQPDQQTLW